MSLGRTLSALTVQRALEVLAAHQWSIYAAAKVLEMSRERLTKLLHEAKLAETVRQHRLAARPKPCGRPRPARVCDGATHRWRFQSRVWSNGTLTRTWRCRDCTALRREVAGAVPAAQAATYGA